MHRATSSSSSSSEASSRRSRTRQLTREQLLKGLQILGPVSAPLPPELPPSPPASREPSPAPGLKRRHDPDSEQGHNKKPRVTPSSPSPSASSRPRSSSGSRPAPSAAAPSFSRHELCEDGEVKEESSGSSVIPVPSSFRPARRPRRCQNKTSAEWTAIYEKCFAKARKLRFSALSRVAAAHSSTSKEYRPLRNPPHPSSPYAKHSLLMARLELIDSLLHFVYGLWCMDYEGNKCYRAAWRTLNEFMAETAKKVTAESHDEREKAFVGLVNMVEAHIHGRKLKYHMKHIDGDNWSKLRRLRIEWKAELQAKQARDEAAAQASAPNGTPNMLPSPASSNAAGSSNSTPLGGHGTPAVNPLADLDLDKLPPAPPHVHIGVNTPFFQERAALVLGYQRAAQLMRDAQHFLNLPIMARQYPRTLARMMYSTLGPQDEGEPDFQDDDCELYWPTQSITGDGLGWVCLMGMAMVKEFGKEYGYQGVDGAVPRQGGEDVQGFPEPRFIPHTR